ncbi:DUF2117 domain-containing protein [Methanobrevibacter sp. TMH8]|uniref:DUF2117 domain-containing protein n=1 Tax=Methanobrevibacter sp. TMH8 TaxID=2848611 RepID=UPI001CCC9C7C|nr:DUF2117 domain-containing protein [Methanobrevibacter sp. TMH8]MBZ9571666.1 DUF2117 domain-containing protein [Methanobrevibacter sp. TMH8]
MKIGIVVHGPNIVDSGYALKIINFLKNFGEVHCILGGTMGRTAVIDTSLEDLIDISTKRLPSQSVKLFLEKNVDVIFLLNYGKSSLTGQTFGFKVFKNSFFNNSINNKINRKSVEFIQIERPGEFDGNIIHWIGKDNDLILKLSELLDLNILNPEIIVNKYFKDELKIFNRIISDNTEDNINVNNEIKDGLTNGIADGMSDGITDSNNDNTGKNIEKVRNIYGASPNENIFVNGIVIGKSKSENVSLVSKNDRIVEIIGGDIKIHGVEKLGTVDIEKAIVKTGLLRKSNPNPRILSKTDNINIKAINKIEKDYINVAFIDHAAEDIYNLDNIDLAVTIGDDTTLVASDILFRFNIPIIGITDGDLDKVVENGYVADKSVIIEVKSGFDDIVGKSIFKNLFNSKYYLKLPIIIYKNKDNNENKENFRNNRDIKFKIFEDFKKEVFKIVNNITTEYKIK